MPENDCRKCHTLKAACDEAFVQHPHSCSHAVWHVIKKYNPNQPYLTANSLVHTFSTNPQWQEVQLFELSQLASEGSLVVGGATGQSHGHVIVVYPGQTKDSGGYSYKNRKSGKMEKARSLGIYPLAMSTSMGSWPGAKNNGDKTVIDPWPNTFSSVRFWKYVGNR
jgi:hypothetical protein